MKLFGYFKYAGLYFCKSFPVEVTFFVTSKCNFRCKHCFNWQAIDESKQKKELAIDEIRKVTENTPHFLRLLLSGGEPYLRNDLPEICHLFYMNCKVKYISIPTNGSMPDRNLEMTGKILRLCPDAYINISLSLDALGKKRDEFVGFNGSFEKFEETYSLLQGLKKKYTNLGIFVITTHAKDNENDLLNIYDYATKKLKVDNFGFNVVRGSPKLSNVKDVDLRYFKELTKKMADDSKKRTRSRFPFHNMYITKKNFQYEMFYKIRKDKKYVIPCYSGKIRFVMNEVGDIYPCETYMYDRPQLKFGNVRDYNYNVKKIIKSIRAREITDMIRKTKCFCTHECDLSTNILFNIKFLPKLLVRSVLRK